jgi:hypothetical protein
LAAQEQEKLDLKVKVVPVVSTPVQALETQLLKVQAD